MDTSMRSLVLFSLVTFTATALADGQAVIRSGNAGQAAATTISWQDDKVRLDVPGEDAYMLVLDGRGYSVARTGGQTMVMDLSSMPQFGPGGMGQGAPATSDVARITRLEATGREETVAGIEGEIYEMSWTDAKGRENHGEAVLTDDSRVREMQQAFWTFSRAITRQQEEIGARLRAEGLAMLRLDDQFLVEEIRADSRPAGDFELPAEPMDMQEMMRGMQH
jgi:hypothetical protein